MKHILTLAALLLLLPAGRLTAQACCSAGVPLLGALEIPATEKGTLMLSLAWDQNILEDVISGRNTVHDDTRIRRTDAALLEASVGLGGNFSVSMLASYVRHERRTQAAGTPVNTVTTVGIGDLVLLGKKALIVPDIVKQRELTIGAGVKAPLGDAAMQF